MCFVLCRDESIDTLELDALDITIPSSQHVNKIRSEMEVAAHNKLYFKQCSVIHCNAAPVPCRPLSRKHRPPALAGITCRGGSSRLDLVNDKMLDHWIPYIWAWSVTVNDYKWYMRLSAVRAMCLIEIHNLSAQTACQQCLQYNSYTAYTAYTAYRAA